MSGENDGGASGNSKRPKLEVGLSGDGDSGVGRDGYRFAKDEDTGLWSVQVACGSRALVCVLLTRCKTKRTSIRGHFPAQVFVLQLSNNNHTHKG